MSKAKEHLEGTAQVALRTTGATTAMDRGLAAQEDAPSGALPPGFSVLDAREIRTQCDEQLARRRETMA
ncbi:MAG TPA: hypothetical protein VEE84_09040, partial [Burkholderiaceae bacterium]|nr:hypothetical protein [Burkholderiaceae bacterium]